MSCRYCLSHHQSQHAKGCRRPRAKAVNPRAVVVGGSGLAVMTLQEVGDLFGMTKQAVLDVERRALAKMWKHPVMRRLAADYGLSPDE